MDFSDILLYCNAVNLEPQSPILREICESYFCDVDDTTSNTKLEEYAQNILKVWEVSKEDGEDVFGPYTITMNQNEANDGDTLYYGMVRLKPGAHQMIPPMPQLGSYAGLDLSNMPPICGCLNLPMILCGKSQTEGFTNSGMSRLILPEVYPQMRHVYDGQLYGQLPTCGPAAPKVLLSKHFAVHTTNSQMFTGNTNSRFTEEIVIAPKDMDAQFHLNRFTKMSAETIVGILENLADVSEREESYTLTLGSTNLEKLTEEQKNIAIEKGWNLA